MGWRRIHSLQSSIGSDSEEYMHVIGQIRMQREIGCTPRLLFIVTLFQERIQRDRMAKEVIWRQALK